jgi:hypothetical protein
MDRRSAVRRFLLWPMVHAGAKALRGCSSGQRLEDLTHRVCNFRFVQAVTLPEMIEKLAA